MRFQGSVFRFGAAKDLEGFRLAGFQEWLIKPINCDDLMNVIHRVTGAA